MFKEIQAKLKNCVRKQEVLKNDTADSKNQIENLELKNIRNNMENAIHQIRYSKRKT